MDVLLVEDDPADVRIVKELVREQSMCRVDLRVTGTLKDALEECRRALPQAVLLDLNLSDSRELDTFRSLAREFPGLPIVVLTGIDDGQTRLAVIQLGAQNYLIKGEMNSHLLWWTLEYAVERKGAEVLAHLAREVLEVLNRPDDVADAIRDILLLIREDTGLEAAGIRLRVGDDFPYYCTSGFSDHFVRAESRLCARDVAGDLVRDATGNPVLECMCGNVLCGRTDPKFPFFTEGGSFWSNGTSELLAACRTRNADEVERGTGNDVNAEVGIRHGGNAERGVTEEVWECGGVGVAERGAGNAECGSEEAVPASDTPRSELRVPTSGGSESPVPRLLDRCNGEGYESVALIPLHSDGEIIGLLQLNDRRPDRFTAEMIRFFEGLSASIGIALARKQTRDALLQARDEWARTFDAIADMVTVHDMDFNIVRANKSARGILGLPFLELSEPGVKCFKCFHGTAGAPADCASCNCLKTGKSAAFEVFEPHLNRHLEIQAVPRLDSDGRMIGLIHVARDITVRKQAEIALRQSEARYRRVIETTQEGFGEIDLTGRIVAVNPRLNQIFGYAPGEMIGLSIVEDLSFPEDRIALRERLERRKQGKAGPYDQRYRKKTGESLWLIVSASVVMDANGVVSGSFAMVMDITERKQAEEQVARQLDELRRWHAVTVGREERIAELKREVNEIAARLGEKPRYGNGPAFA